jgi:hypothetical protein
MSTIINSETPHSIQRQIEMLNMKYQEELKKGSELAIRKAIRIKIRELETTLDSLLKAMYPNLLP